MPRFVVVGAGHSGTKFIARAMSLMGVPCGHEDVYDHDEATSGSAERWGSLTGEASLAAGGYPLPADCRRILVVREPIAVVRSWMGVHFFADTCPCHRPGEHLKTPYVQWMLRTAPDLFGDADDELGRTIAWTARWPMLLAETADEVLRVEDIDAATLVRLAGDYGGRTDLDYADQVLAALGTRTNAHPPGPDLGWAEISGHPLGGDLAAYADRFGYRR